MNEQKLDKLSEPPYAKKSLELGEFGVGLFRGQTFLFIPLPIYNVLGSDKIHSLAEIVYEQVRLDVFRGSNGLYQNSYFMELPAGQELLNAFLTALREATTGLNES